MRLPCAPLAAAGYDRHPHVQNQDVAAAKSAIQSDFCSGSSPAEVLQEGPFGGLRWARPWQNRSDPVLYRNPREAMVAVHRGSAGDFRVGSRADFDQKLAARRLPRARRWLRATVSSYCGRSSRYEPRMTLRVPRNEVVALRQPRGGRSGAAHQDAPCTPPCHLVCLRARRQR